MALKTRFCAKCGKETASLLSGLCSLCYLKENPMSMPRKVILKVCPKCGAIRWRGVWLASKKSPDDYFRQTIEEKIKLPKDAKVVKMELGDRAVFTLSVLGDLIKVEKKLEFKIDKFACPECSRQHSEWASKIQLRRRGEIPVDDILAMASKHKMRIIKTEQKKNGLDLYFFTKPTANKLASRLVKRFGYFLKRSYEQHGHDFDVGRPKHREIISLK